MVIPFHGTGNELQINVSEWVTHHAILNILNDLPINCAIGGGSTNGFMEQIHDEGAKEVVAENNNINLDEVDKAVQQL